MIRNLKLHRIGDTVYCWMDLHLDREHHRVPFIVLPSDGADERRAGIVRRLWIEESGATVGLRADGSTVHYLAGARLAEAPEGPWYGWLVDLILEVHPDYLDDAADARPLDAMQDEPRCEWCGAAVPVGVAVCGPCRATYPDGASMSDSVPW